MKLKPFTLFFFFLATASLLIAEEVAVDPYEWVIETYRFPSQDLIHGFASLDRGELRPPALPAADASQEEIDEFIRKSSSYTLHFLEKEGLALPKGAIVLFDPESQSLAARLPRIAQSSVSFYSHALLQQIASYLVYDFSLFEGPGEILRETIDAARANADHTNLLEQLEGNSAIDLVQSERTESNSGERVRVALAREETLPVEFFVSDDKEVDYGSETYDNGTTLELDSSLAADESIVLVNFSLKHHYAQRSQREEIIASHGGTDLAVKLIDVPSVSLSSQLYTQPDTTKLLGVWRPQGIRMRGDDSDSLQAAFLTTNVVKTLPLVNPRLAEMLTNRGDAILPTPKGKIEFETVAEEIPNGMTVRRYTVPPNFLSMMGSGGAGGDSDDPFAATPANEPRFTVRATAKNILESVGVTFPRGASANYIRATSTLVVRNTPEQIELVEAMIVSLNSGVPHAVAIETHIVEAPREALLDMRRATRSIPDHEVQWNELIAQDDVKILSSTRLEALSGERTKIDTGRDYSYPTGISFAFAIPKEKRESLIGLSPEIESERVGHVLEIDPQIGADSKTISLSLSNVYDVAQPEITGSVAQVEEGQLTLEAPKTVFHRSRLGASTTMLSGAIRMISLTQPEGVEEGKMHALFVRATVIDVVPDE